MVKKVVRKIEETALFVSHILYVVWEGIRDARRK